mmetsp:Transcript_11564/g.25353  ORF Transcript_11564/g.25353 Transcript_11564/m.25353 type:complete len:158 (-) Transcript_11564:22-495(-)
MSNLIVDFPNRHAESCSNARAVQFSQTEEIMFFERHAKSDATNIWYSIPDIEAMKIAQKRNIRDTHKRLSLLSLRDDMNFTEELDFFGIEKLLSPRLIKNRVALRIQHWRLVLAEQARQDDLNEHDPCRLACVAYTDNQQEARRAHVIGLMQSQHDA